jgi:hypothetical protein
LHFLSTLKFLLFKVFAFKNIYFVCFMCVGFDVFFFFTIFYAGVYVVRNFNCILHLQFYNIKDLFWFSYFFNWIFLNSFLFIFLMAPAIGATMKKFHTSQGFGDAILEILRETLLKSISLPCELSNV